LIAGKNTPRTASMRPKATSSNSQPPSVGNYSASPIVRYASTTGLQPLPSYPVLQMGPGTNPGASVPQQYGGGGATGSWGVPAQSGVPMWAYRRLYTKKGTPRRVRRDGMPYAVPRMNPMNANAARRAIRRIRGARKLLQRIERSLPKQTHRRRAA
jgi:hypothetical protein